MDKVLYKNEDNKCFFIFQRDSFKNITVSSNFIKALKYNLKHDVTEIYVDLSQVRGGYPNLYVTIAGIIEYYKSEFDKFIFEPKISKSSHVYQVINPYDYTNSENTRTLFSKVYRFTSDNEVEYYSSRIINELAEEIHFADGTLIGLSWCMNEIMDNVLNHSNIEYGYITTQIHNNKSSIVVSVFDNGQGLFNSLKGSSHSPKNNLDAITLSIKKGVTRDTEFGQGNGLWGLSTITINNGGALTITSGSNSLNVSHNDYDGIEHASRHFDHIPYHNRKNRTTLINFTLRYDKAIDLISILDDYEPFEKFQRDIETHEIDEGSLVYKISEISQGTGTRQAGKKVRNLILNILKTTSGKIILDFSNISVITSSYADEFIGKLVKIIGFVNYNEHISIKNYNPLISKIINKAIIDRMKSEL